MIAAHGLTPWAPDRGFTDDDVWLDFSDFGAPHPWWTPPTAITPEVAVVQEADGWVFARRDGGTLWFKAISH